MGLINKTVMLRWNSKNKNIFIKKGYFFTKINNYFEVNVSDLLPYSKAFVDVKCDGCGKILKNITWVNYLKCVKEDGKYYCRKCSINLNGGENIRLAHLKNGKSFEKWCLDNNRQDVLNRWDYELNNCNPNNINCWTVNKYYFKCPKGIHKSELKQINIITMHNNPQVLCNQCNSFAQCGIDNLGDDFLEKYWDYEKNIINPWDISKSSGTKKVWIKCQEKDYHGSYDIRCYDFINGVRCGFCGNHKTHYLDSLGYLYPQVLDIWSDKNKKSPYEYSPHSMTDVYWKCENNRHKDYKRNVDSSTNYNFRCPECSKENNNSLLQDKVKIYINNLNYTILHENNCTLKCINPKTMHQLPYDNEIKELKLIIETHGIQHYEITGFHILSANKNNTTPEQELYYQKLKDRYKRIFAKRQGYFYLEIPYWTDDKNETWKKLIDDKIKYILIKE